jgi:hypothetical protein
MLAGRPGDGLDHDAAGGAIHPAHPIEQKHKEAPQGDELEPTRREMIVAGGRPMTAGANRRRPLPRSDRYFDGGPLRGAGPRSLADKSPKVMTLV